MTNFIGMLIGLFSALAGLGLSFLINRQRITKNIPSETNIKFLEYSANNGTR